MHRSMLPRSLIVLRCLDRGAGTRGERKRIVTCTIGPDYVAQTVIMSSPKETGIAVRYDTFDYNDTLKPKWLAGRSGL